MKFIYYIEYIYIYVCNYNSNMNDIYIIVIQGGLAEVGGFWV